jgi:hypothetical protein
MRLIKATPMLDFDVCHRLLFSQKLEKLVPTCCRFFAGRKLETV